MEKEKLHLKTYHQRSINPVLNIIIIIFIITIIIIIIITIIIIIIITIIIIIIDHK